MQTVSNDNFGPLVAYLLPGATALLGMSEFSPTLRSWFSIGPTEGPTIGGFLYLTVAALAVGMTVSAVRWAVVDTCLRWTGLRPPRLDFSSLGTKVQALTLLIDIYYRHFLYYANMFVAAAVAYACFRVRHGGLHPLWLDGGFLVLEAILFMASRDTLRNYYRRTAQILSADGRAGSAAR